MARNVAISLLRGIKANMPPLGIGELYLATDEVQLYVGTSVGNKLVLCNTTATPSGSGGGVSAPAHKIGDVGPTAPQKIVTYVKFVLNGTTFWIPLMQ